jgi:hypothetical protein
MEWCRIDDLLPVAAGHNSLLGGFVGSVGKLTAAAKSLDAVGEFLAQQLKATAAA